MIKVQSTVDKQLIKVKVQSIKLPEIASNFEVCSLRLKIILYALLRTKY